MYTRKNAPEEASTTSSAKRTSFAGSKPDLSEEEAARRLAARKRAAARRQAKKRRLQKRIFLLAAGLFLSAVLVLVWAVVQMIRRANPHQMTTDASPIPSSYAGHSGNNHGDPGSLSSGAIPRGVKVNGVQVGDMSVESARSLLEDAFEQDLNSVAITLQSEYFNATLTRYDIGAYFDVDDALSQAASGYFTEVKTPMLFDIDALTNALAKLNDKVPGHATNATMSIAYDSYTVGKTSYQKPKFVYTEGTNGMQLDTAAVKKQIENALQSGTYQLSFSPSVTVSEPAVTVESLKKATTKLSSFSTVYYFTGNSSKDKDVIAIREGRDYNISKGAGIMNVITLKPGESFSFNKKTGDRTEKKGWALAPAIYGKDHRPEPGGGICQVSTTMYNALLLAGVEITYHRPHTIPSDYVDLGWDATVDSGHIDFKFKNNKQNTIYLFVYITKNKDSNRKKEIHVDVYGMEEPGVTYKTWSERISTDKAQKPEIKYDKKQYVDYQVKTREAHDGYVVATYVDMYINNIKSKTIYSYTATYDKIEEQWIYGSKPTPTPPPTKTPKPTRTPKATPEYYDTGF